MDDLEYSNEFIQNIGDEMLDRPNLSQSAEHDLYGNISLKVSENLNNFAPHLQAEELDDKLHGRLDISNFEKELGYDLPKSHKNSSDIEHCMGPETPKAIKSSPVWAKNEDINEFKPSSIFNKVDASPLNNEIFTKRVKLEIGEISVE